MATYSQAQRYVNCFPPRASFFNCWNDPGFRQQYPHQAQDGSVEKEAIPDASSSRMREEEARRGAAAFPLIQLCSIFNTSEGMMFYLGWPRLVTAGSIASSSEVNAITFRIYTDVSEWTISTLLLSDCFSASKKFALHFNGCHTKRCILQIQRCDQDIQNASLGWFVLEKRPEWKFCAL